MRRIATVVSILCALSLATGLAEPAPRVLAAAADAPTLLPGDQTPVDGIGRALFLVRALRTADLPQGLLIVVPAPQAPQPTGRGTVSDLARAPPHQAAIRFP